MGDPVAADVYAARVLKEVHEPFELGFSNETFAYAARLGLGVDDPGAVVLKEVDA